MFTLRFAIGVFFVLLMSGAQAQELRCTQIFMNASEKRICATPALMKLDEQIGELGRRAALHQDSFKSDQRKFRKALKTCKGDETCLTSSYKFRIAELQGFVDSLPPPTVEESAKLNRTAEKAQAKRDAQADTREEIAQQIHAKDLEQAATEMPNMAIETPAPIEEPSTPISDSPAEPIVQEAPVDIAATQAEQSALATVNADGIDWTTTGILGAVILAVLVWFKSWLNKAVRRCPGCKRWFAGKVVDQDRESYTDYETKTFIDEHRNRSNNVVGSTSREQQVSVRVVETTDYLQCNHCNCKWALSSTSRSS